MNRLLRVLALAATGAAAISIYRQLQRHNQDVSRRHPLENWENEGGALPEQPATAAAPNARSTRSHAS